MIVLFPAPFSPSRQCTSPGSTTRSIPSFATSDPKRLVIPRSSSFTATSEPGGAGGRQPGRAGPASLRLRGRRDLDLARDDVLLDRVELALEVRGHLAVELVERRQAGPVVLQGADVAAGREGAGGRTGDVGVHGLGEILHHAAEEQRALRRHALAAVGVDPQHADLAVRRQGRLPRTFAGTACHREQDVGALLDELLADLLTLVLVREGLGERAGLLVLLVPAQDLDVLALL